ncbi:MAG: amidohydrolase family protein [Victivallaceae bacterium]|nr:amidohydrolase family protein [Victivallaceae bacterium]
MKTIDLHTHVFPQYADLAIKVMNRCSVETAGLLAWHDGFGPGLRKYLELSERYPGRFVIFGNVDFSRINEPDFGEKAAAQLAADVKAGMSGLKIYKALGLEYRGKDNSFRRINDPGLYPIWETAGKLGIPVLIHTADPVYFWQPVNKFNFWNGVLYGEYAWWSYYRKHYPSLEELIAERDEVIALFPETQFICPHLGSLSHALIPAAEALDNFPNLYYDISARIPEMGKSEVRSEYSREFIIKYQDRILFGTDMIYDDLNVAAGVQAQSLYQPGEVALNGADPEASYIETSVDFFASHIRFLSGNGVQEHPPFNRSREPFRVYELGLPEKVVRKLVWENPRNIIAGNVKLKTGSGNHAPIR